MSNTALAQKISTPWPHPLTRTLNSARGKSVCQADASGGSHFLENSFLPDRKYFPHQDDMPGLGEKYVHQENVSRPESIGLA